MRRNLIRLLYSFFFLLFTLSPLILSAQTFGIKGRILSAESSEVINGAAITLKGTAFSNISVGGGYFTFEVLLQENILW